MKIKTLKINGLHGNEEEIFITFNNDLNILSGRNGAGKTTILKLMWYLISGNFDKAVAEIKFNSAQVITDKYELTVNINFDNKNTPFSSELKVLNVDVLKNKGFEKDEKFKKILNHSSKTNMAWFFTQYIDTSFFMPTFRMIEGGFTTEKYDIKHDVVKEFFLNLNSENDYNDINDALKKLSQNLTKKDHKFITSISAKDIDIFLVKKYAEIMKRVNSNQDESLQLLNKKVKMIVNNEINTSAYDSLDKKLDEIENEINILNSPLDKIRTSILNFMPNFMIEFDEKIYFSSTPTLIDQNDLDAELYLQSDYPIDLDVPFDLDSYIEEDGFDTNEPSKLTINNLSAGEKQLLTFVAYNIFHNNTIFFIDEPELSLHVDWQSKLFSLLKEQNSTNQFIISTHSPFIYSIFPDKEIIINNDKGCSGF